MDNRFQQANNQGSVSADPSEGGRPSEDGRQVQGQSRSGKRSRRGRGTIYSILLLGAGCLLLAIVGLFITSYPVLALWIPRLSPSGSPQVQIQHPQSFAQVNIPKPAYTPTPGLLALEPVIFTPTPGLEAAEQPSLVVSIVQPTEFPTQVSQAVDNYQQPVDNSQVSVENSAGNPVDNTVPTVISVDNFSPSVIFAEIVPDTPTPEYVAAAPSTSSSSDTTYSPVSGSGEHWIDVNLSQQRVYAYEGDNVANSFIVSTGTWQTPTVTGKFKIWIKLLSTAMSGPGYYLPDVPYTMYFYKGYGLHGTYWHNNFGTPMSHGCVNLSIPDAQWLYNFSSVGTLVNVHY